MFYVYILSCSDGSYYVGHTDDLESRIAAHRRGEIEGYTRTRCPVRVVFSEEFPAREDALARERRVKGWSRAKKEALSRAIGVASVVLRAVTVRHAHRDPQK
jgi:predicted GIY-YIG superfamily endonuclease